MTNSEALVFLSYPSSENEFASRLRDDLEHSGIKVWKDNAGGIEGGDNWKQSIETAIDNSTVFVAIITKAYIERKWCKRELDRADANDLPIIPIYLKSIERLPIQIESIQYIDFRQAVNDADLYKNRFDELTRQIHEKVRATPPLLTSRSNLEQTTTSKYNVSKRRRDGCTLYGVITLTMAILSLIVAIIAIPDDRLIALVTSIKNVFENPNVVMASLSPEDLSLIVEREALYRELSDVISPQNLLIVPGVSGNTLWGYGAANHVLFAVDIGTGNLLTIADGANTINMSEKFGDNFLPSTMYFDGTWVWIGDARNDRIIAIDPYAQDAEPLASFTLDGDPLSMSSTGDILWVGLRDKQQIVAFTVNHTNISIDPYCQIAVDTPINIVPEEQIAIWATSGRTDTKLVSRINVQTCQITSNYEIQEPAQALEWNSGTLWFVTGGDLYRLSDAMDQPALVDLPDGVQVTDILLAESDLWLLTNNQHVMLYHLQSGDFRLDIRQDSTVNSMIANGKQLWIAREDNSLSRYLVPDYVYPGLIDLAWTNRGLWAVNTTNQLCNISNQPLSCNNINHDGEPIALTTASDNETMWVGFDDNQLLRIDPNNNEILQKLTVTDLIGPQSIISVDNEIWISDLLTATIVVDIDTGKQTLLQSLNIAAPSALAYDGTNVWFADNFSRQIFTVARVGQQLSQQNHFDLPTPTIEQLLATGSGVILFTTGSVNSVSPLSGHIQNSVGIGSRIDDVAVADDGIWIADRANGFIYKIQSL